MLLLLLLFSAPQLGAGGLVTLVFASLSYPREAVNLMAGRMIAEPQLPTSRELLLLRLLLLNALRNGVPSSESSPSHPG